jgi:uncharacterized repeat protein (TIGR03803 family)
MKNKILVILYILTNTILSNAQNPVLWGYADQGGQHSYGIILNYNITTGTETDKYDFAGSPGDGQFPLCALIKANNGLLYGLTQGGGAYNEGTIFSYNISTGAETDLHDFGSSTDGQGPPDALIQASDGLLYGMTQNGGT